MRIIFVILCPFNACNFEFKYLLLKSKIIAKLSRILQKNFCIPKHLPKTSKSALHRCIIKIWFCRETYFKMLTRVPSRVSSWEFSTDFSRMKLIAADVTFLRREFLGNPFPCITILLFMLLLELSFWNFSSNNNNY